MEKNHSLNRFIEAQQTHYPIALAEIKQGKKRSHWMWYIFPQIEGLGFSETSKFYAIKDIEEAEAFLKHPDLGNRLISICNELLKQGEKNANIIFGSPDDLKLKSSMTLFSLVPNADPVFQLVLNKFFNGEQDRKTMSILEGHRSK
jgi:uncharacterized protein (DUF1810 family)